MTLLQSVFLGLLQGLTEFLPISSSGHLILASKLFELESSLLLIILLHIGTLLSVIIYYRRTIIAILAHPIADKRLLYIVLASIPTFALALVARYLLPSSVLDGALLPIGFALTIVLLVLSSTLYKPRRMLTQCKIPTIALIGITQGLAVIPGLSRSGSTISVMKLLGIDNNDSGQFSFLLSIPVILASAVVEIYQSGSSISDTPWYCYVVGGVVALLSGLVAIHTVHNILSKGRWGIFALYLVIPLVLSLIIL